MEQHRRAVQAAKEAGVKHIAYISVVHMQAGEASNPIAANHRASEQIIFETGLPYTILRNTFYAEFMLQPVVEALDESVFVSSIGDGKLGAVARADMAEAAAAVLSEPGLPITYLLVFGVLPSARPSLSWPPSALGKDIQHPTVHDHIRMGL